MTQACGTLSRVYMPIPPSTYTQHTQSELPYWSKWRGKQVMNTSSGGRTMLSLSAQSHLSRSTERKSRSIHSSSSKDSSLLHIHQMNWSPRSSMNYAATHQLCSISLSCSEKHTSQPLLMPSEFFLDLMFKPMSQIKTVDMSSTGWGTHSTNDMVSRIYIQMHRQPVHWACNA